MQMRNVNAAVNQLSENMRNGILPLNNETLKHRKLKHSQLKKADRNALVSDIPERIHAVKLESIDAELVRRAATKTKR